MTPSLAEATAAARRIQAGDYPGVPLDARRIARRQDALLLAGFVLAGDTERLRADGGAGLIAAERERQISEEGWTPEHDDGHREGELAQAACCYATDPETRAEIMLTEDGVKKVNLVGSGYEPRHWPAEWSGWWRPHSDDRVRELVKAGALIAAEIDRLIRAALAEGGV